MEVMAHNLSAANMMLYDGLMKFFNNRVLVGPRMSILEEGKPYLTYAVKFDTLGDWSSILINMLKGVNKESDLVFRVLPEITEKEGVYLFYTRFYNEGFEDNPFTKPEGAEVKKWT